MKLFRRNEESKKMESQLRAQLDIYRILEKSDQKFREEIKLYEGKKDLKKSIKLSINIVWVLFFINAIIYWLCLDYSGIKEYPFIRSSLFFSISSVILSWMVTYPSIKEKQDKVLFFIIYFFILQFILLISTPLNKSQLVILSQRELFIFSIIQLTANIFLIESILKNQKNEEHFAIYHTIVGMLSVNKKIPTERIYYLDHQKFFRVYIKGVTNPICEIITSRSGDNSLIIDDEKYNCNTSTVLQLRKKLTEKIESILEKEKNQYMDYT
jgi:hypothetical protein